MAINGDILICQTARQYSSWFGHYIIEMDKNNLCANTKFKYIDIARDIITNRKIIPFNYDKANFDIDYILKNSYIRRLTPNECLKLMGYDTENHFHSIVSDNQLYKQCGNSIVVNLFISLLVDFTIDSIIR
jgi:DNA (cytosine-5)-methyltransferase 1